MSTALLTPPATPSNSAAPSATVSRDPSLDFEPQPIAVPGVDVPRVVGHIVGNGPGPTLICVGGLHGNEPAGLLGAQRVLATIAAEGTELSGQLLVLAGNRSALRAGQRFIDQDLNRVWSDENVERLHEQGFGNTVEEKELLQLDLELRQAINTSEEVFLLDLHSTSGPSPSFVVLEDSLVNRQFGLSFPAPLVLGIEEELGGTLYHYLSRLGVVGITIETGSHRDPSTADRAESAIWIALEAAGLLAPGHPHACEGRERLESDKGKLPDVVEIHYRHGLSQQSQFRMNPGYSGFQVISEGEELATDGETVVRANSDGFLLMPLYQPQGEDGFFLVRAVHPAWMGLSAVVRRLRAERFIHWLPGVHREEGDPARFTVDRGIARWFALELFHLLGFQREGPVDRQLVMVRRNDG